MKKVDGVLCADFMVDAVCSRSVYWYVALGLVHAMYW